MKRQRWTEPMLFRLFKITLPYMLYVTTPYLIVTFTGNVNNFNIIYLSFWRRSGYGSGVHSRKNRPACYLAL